MPRKLTPKTAKARRFIKELCKQIEDCLDRVPEKPLEVTDQAAISGYLAAYLRHRKKVNVNKDFYWPKQKGTSPVTIRGAFGGRLSPDFIILKPYRIVIEYKKYRPKTSGTPTALMNNLIGSVIAVPRNFDFVLAFYRDATRKGKIFNAMKRKEAKEAKKELEENNNVFLHVVNK